MGAPFGGGIWAVEYGQIWVYRSDKPKFEVKSEEVRKETFGFPHFI
jgi:hypothetical protein